MLCFWASLSIAHIVCSIDITSRTGDKLASKQASKQARELSGPKYPTPSAAAPQYQMNERSIRRKSKYLTVMKSELSGERKERKKERERGKCASFLREL
jgi:hypothetical protein